MKNANNVIDASEKFGSNTSPDAYRISMHIRNMMIAYGEDYVRDVITELFLVEKKSQTRKTRNKKAVGAL